MFLLALSYSAIAQTTQATPPAPATIAPAAVVSPPPVSAAIPDASGKYKLREGEEVNLTFAQDLSSKTSQEGDPVALTLADDLKVGGVVVAKSGCKVVARSPTPSAPE